MRRLILTLSAIFLALPGLALAQLAGTAPVPPVTAADIVLGPATAKVTVIEYASLSCPHCARFEAEMFPKVKAEFIDTGKIRYVFRDFPLNAQAVKAAQLAHCDPQRYYNFLSALFSTQATWGYEENPEPELLNVARLGGIAPEKFHQCLADSALETAIITSRQGGEEAGVTGTPYFFFNGIGHSGEMTLDAFRKAVADAPR